MNLMASLCDPSILSIAFERVKQNNGCPGVDNVTVAMFAEHQTENLAQLLNELENETYKPREWKQAPIYRLGKDPRPLVIATVRERVVHTAIALILQPYLEKHFADCSWGYRPGRSYLDAVDKVTEYRKQGLTWLLDADISKFFDNVQQATLLDKVLEVVPDQKLNAFIEYCLFSKQLTEHELTFGTSLGFGIPQGSPLSPMLANLYLTSLDRAFLAAKFAIVRYADDFVICTESKVDAEHAYALAEKQLTELHLQLNKEKTQVTSFTEGFRFLGHSFVGDMVLEDRREQLLSNQIESLEVQTNKSTQQQQATELADISVTLSFSHPTNEAMLGAPVCNSGDEEKLKLVQPYKLKTLYLTEPGSVAHLNGHRMVVTQSRQTIGQVPLATLEMVVVMTRCQLTTDATVYCLKHQIVVIYCSQLGGFYGVLDDFSLSRQTTLEQQLQLANSNKGLPIATEIVDSKLHNAAVVVRRFCRKRPTLSTALEKYNKATKQRRNQLKKTKKLESIRGIEGQAAKAYFELWRALLPDYWQFKHRNRMPPKDPINVLLSLGYTLLFNNIYAIVVGRGLFGLLGVLHKGDRKPNLVLDLMEIFRPIIVDALVLKLTLNGVIAISDFSHVNGQCLLSKDGKKRFIKSFEEKMQSQLLHPTLSFPLDHRRLIEWQIDAFKAVLLKDEPFETVRIR